MSRLLAVCGWLSWLVTGPIDATPLRWIGGRRIGAGVVGVLLGAAAGTIVSDVRQDQPQVASVGTVMAGGVTRPDGWIRISGRIFGLDQAPTDEPGDYGLLIDSVSPIRAIVVEPAADPDPSAEVTVTGRLAPAEVSLREELPLEATVFGAPPDVVGDQLLRLDAVAQPQRVVRWADALGLTGLAVALAIGLIPGYPAFRPSARVDALARPLSPGERLRAAIGGRIQGERPSLDDPAEADLLSRQGPIGPILLVQMLSNGGPASSPVPIRGRRAGSMVGDVYTLTDRRPALAVQGADVDAIIVFSRSSDRDRAAVMLLGPTAGRRERGQQARPQRQAAGGRWRPNPDRPRRTRRR